MSLPKQLDEGPVRLSSQDGWVASKLVRTPTEAVDLEGDSAAYEGTKASPDFDFATLANGLKENIELSDASQPATYSFELSASNGLTPSLAADGSVEFRGEDNQLVATLPAPVMFDSATPEPEASHAIHYELADQGWISAPERVFPIRLDPTITVPSPSLDCRYLYYNVGTTNNACGSKGETRLRATTSRPAAHRSSNANARC